MTHAQNKYLHLLVVFPLALQERGTSDAGRGVASLRAGVRGVLSKKCYNPSWIKPTFLLPQSLRTRTPRRAGT